MTFQRELIYNKIFSALDKSYPGAHEAATLLTHHAMINGIDSNQSAWDIISQSKRKSAETAANKKYPPSTAGTTGVKDRQIPESSYSDDFQSCMKGLQDLGIEESTADEECSAQWKGEGERGGKLRQKLMRRVRGKFPLLPPNKVAQIVDEKMREAQVRENIKKSQKGISRFEATRHIYAASIDKVIPAHEYINLVREGKIDPESTTSNIKSGSEYRGARNYASIQMHQDGKKFEDQTNSKIISGSVKVNAWLFTDRKLVNRNAFEYQRQEAGKKSNIRNASTTTDNRPAWLQIMDYYAKGSPN